MSLNVQEHILPLSILIATGLTNMCHIVNVGRYRKKARVPFPIAYVEAEEAKKDFNKMRFNCAQRAHYNFIEYLPTFMSLFAVSTLKYPRAASVAGAYYLVARIIFMIGYSTGDPKKRFRGFYHPALLALLGMSLNVVISIFLN